MSLTSTSYITTNNRTTMSGREYSAMSLSYDRQTAREMVAAIQYTPTAEETAYVEALEQERRERKERKAAKKARKHQLVSDTASISSFSSTVGLLKSKLSRKSRDEPTSNKRFSMAD